MLRFFPRIARSAMRPTSISVPSIHRCGYATKTAKAALRAPPVRVAPRILPSEKLAPAAMRQQYKANQIYARGVRNVYQAPSHVGILGFSWLLGGALLTCTFALGSSGHWDMGAQMSGLQKSITETGYRLGMILFGFVGWLAVFRYTGLVKSIDLLQRGGNAKLRLKVRRMVPFLKPNEIIVSTHDLSLPPYWLHQIDDLSLESADLRRRGFSFNLWNIFWVPFVKFRSWVFRHGIVNVTYLEGRAMLDLTGDFSNRGADLWELTSTTKGGMPVG